MVGGDAIAGPGRVLTGSRGKERGDQCLGGRRKRGVREGFRAMEKYKSILGGGSRRDDHDLQVGLKSSFLSI